MRGRIHKFDFFYCSASRSSRLPADLELDFAEAFFVAPSQSTLPFAKECCITVLARIQACAHRAYTHGTLKSPPAILVDTFIAIERKVVDHRVSTGRTVAAHSVGICTRVGGTIVQSPNRNPGIVVHSQCFALRSFFSKQRIHAITLSHQVFSGRRRGEGASDRSIN